MQPNDKPSVMPISAPAELGTAEKVGCGFCLAIVEVSKLDIHSGIVFCPHCSIDAIMLTTDMDALKAYNAWGFGTMATLGFCDDED
jgi:hypothetical protein